MMFRLLQPRLHRRSTALLIAATLLGASATVAAQAPVADSALTQWRQRSSMLTTPAFAATWAQTPAEFRRTWDGALESERGVLVRYRDRLTATQFDEEVLRLRLRHAWGRVVWPYFHWRESDAAEVVPDVALDSLLRTVPLEEERWWSLPEHAALRGALVHEHARWLLAGRPDLRTGDAQWLRAEFAAARELFRSEWARRSIATTLLLTHLDENNARGVDSVYADWVALRPDAATHQRVDSLIADHRAARAGHAIEIYQRIDDVPLELHILRPTAGDTSGIRPAMLWFHGGSGTSGNWSHSPGVVRELRRLGLVVVSVEYRTGNRFDAGPIEQAEDARAAFEYVERHAEQLRIDPERIGVAGFSSGAGLALWLGTRGHSAHALDTDVAATARRYPAAVITSGVCVDPAGPKEDGYFRKRVSARAPVRLFSPIDLIAAGQPRTLMIHAANDEYCDFSDAERFSVMSGAVGNDVRFVPVPNAGHFFGFYDRPGQAIMRAAIEAALAQWGWLRR
jgi:acetyl esterase/lipase